MQKLEAREQDVAQLDQHNIQLESELRRVEQYNHLVKDVIVLKKQLAETQPKRRARQAKVSDTCRATIKVRIPVNQDERVSGAWAEGRA